MAHPLTRSPFSKIASGAVTILFTALMWLFFVWYGDLYLGAALADSLIYFVLLFVCGYLYWFISGLFKKTWLHVAIAIAVQILCLGLTFGMMAAFSQTAAAKLLFIVPLQATLGLAAWTVLSLWYSSALKVAENERIENEMSETVEKLETIDRISVKEGKNIHIIKCKELLYVQAYGDYVILFTPTGKHLKEQTMKYFELHLPDTFVRIHRSCIVNAEQIARIELFGKENYSVTLHNGNILKASAAGYKLLKNRLSL